MKYAGYDAIIIEGRSSTPVYIKVDNDRVTLESAAHLWGKGTFETNKMILDACGPDFCSFAIGPAGENLRNLSTIHSSQANSAGAGLGAVFGSKNMKGFACRGSGAVGVADPKGLMDITDYWIKDLQGAWCNHPVPNEPQAWAERTHLGVWGGWNAGPGKTWGAAPNGPVDLGEQPPGDMKKVARRAHIGALNARNNRLGDTVEDSEKITVKAGACAFCTAGCTTRYHSPALEEAGYNPKVSQLCYSISLVGERLFQPGPFGPTYNHEVIAGLTAKTADDLGFWDNYFGTMDDFRYCFVNGYFEPV